VITSGHAAGGGTSAQDECDRYPVSDDGRPTSSTHHEFPILTPCLRRTVGSPPPLRCWDDEGVTDPAPPRPDDLSAPTRALRTAVVDVEQHAARQGWDGPIGVFALVTTRRALERSPELAGQLPAEAVEAARVDAAHLTSIEQDGLPDSATLEDLLAQLAWPPEVDGAAVVVERVVVPPEAEAALPDDPDAQLQHLLHHPARQDVRIAVGVLRSGESWCALRTRSNDDDDAVGGSVDAVPGLVAALAATLR
jgi:sulfur carrier protein ThiS